MSSLVPLVGWGAVIAASVVAGAGMAAALRLPARVAALVSSFAGGVLLAAVAFELVPDAEERAGLWLTAIVIFGPNDSGKTNMLEGIEFSVHGDAVGAR